MTKFFQLDPEVSGYRGRATVITNHPQLQAGLALIPEVAHLDYQFDGWLGDDIAQMTPCYIVSDIMAAAMEQASLSGYRLEAITVSTTREFDRWQSKMVSRPLPTFVRVLMDGRIQLKGDREVISWSGHDICLGERSDWVPPETPEQTMNASPPYALVVSERALDVMKGFRIENCDVYVLEGP